MFWTDKIQSGEQGLQEQADETGGQYAALVTSLQPMVKRTLVKFGKAVWAKHIFVRNFSFKTYETAGHQTWAIQKGVLFKRGTDRVDRMSVMLSKNMQQLYICCKDTVDYRNCTIEVTRDLSEEALTEALLKACEKRNWNLRN